MTTTEQHSESLTVDEEISNESGFAKGDVLTFTVQVELGSANSELPPAIDDLTHEQIAENIAATLRGSGHRLLAIDAAKALPMGEYQDLS